MLVKSSPALMSKPFCMENNMFSELNIILNTKVKHMTSTTEISAYSVKYQILMAFSEVYTLLLERNALHHEECWLWVRLMRQSHEPAKAREASVKLW